MKIYSPEEIRKIREFFRLTRDQFAGYFFLTYETVKNWEVGRRNPCGPALVLLQQFEEEMLEKIAILERDRAAGRAKLVPGHNE